MKRKEFKPIVRQKEFIYIGVTAAVILTFSYLAQNILFSMKFKLKTIPETTMSQSLIFCVLLGIFSLYPSRTEVRNSGATPPLLSASSWICA
jgi:uncharacterized protein with PQ loop repeat